MIFLLVEGPASAGAGTIAFRYREKLNCGLMAGRRAPLFSPHWGRRYGFVKMPAVAAGIFD
jgi:hypothetical protein